MQSIEKQSASYRQMLFVSEYMVDKNATQAAIRAGYAETYAAEQSCRLLKFPHIRREINRRIQEQAQRLKITAETVLVELLNIAKVDIRQAFDSNGNLKDIHLIPENIARAIGGIEVEEIYDTESKSVTKRTSTGRLKKIKLLEKNKALETLAKHLKLLAESTVVDQSTHYHITKLSDEQLIDAARQRGISLPASIATRIGAENSSQPN